MSAAIDVRLRPAWIPNAGYRYDALLGDVVIVSRSRDPEHDAARALLGRGLRGRFRIIDFVTGKPRRTFDIETAARLRTVERDRGGLSVESYVPILDGVMTRLRVPSTHRGRPLQVGAVPSTREPLPAAGGETWEAPAMCPGEGDLPALPVREEA